MENGKREKQLVKNTAIVAIGQICTKFISFFLLPLYTAVLSTEEYGIVDVLNTYIALLIPLVFLQMDQAVFRNLIDVRNDDKAKSRIMSTALIIVTIQAIIFIMFYIFIGQFINNQYKYFLATNVVATMYASMFLQISRGVGDNITYSIGSLLSGAGTIILNVIFIVIFKFAAYGMLMATLISNIICIVYVFIKKKIYTSLRIKMFSKMELKELWKYAIPLVPNQLSWWIVNASDRTIILFFCGVALNGVYSVANKFSSIIITIFNIFNLTWTESAAVHFKDKDNSKYFSNIINSVLKLFASVCLSIIAFMPFVFKFLVTGAGYSSAFYQIPILIISTIFNMSVALFGSIYVALKKSKEIAKTSIYAAIINIVVNLVLIKHIGLYAASISTAVAYLIMTIYRYIDVQKYIKIKLERSFVILTVLVSSIILIIYYLKNIYLYLLGAILSIIFLIIFNKKTFKVILHVVKQKVLSKKVVC